MYVCKTESSSSVPSVTSCLSVGRSSYVSRIFVIMKSAVLLLVLPATLLTWWCVASAPSTPLPNDTDSNIYLGGLIPNTIDIKKASLGIITVSNITLSGLSHFETVYTKLDLTEKTVYVQIKYRHLHINGEYSIEYFFSKTDEESITADVADVNVLMNVLLGTDGDGDFKVAKMNVDVEFSGCETQLGSQGIGSTVMSWVFTNVCSSLFQAVKSSILEDVVELATDQANRRLKSAIGSNRKAVVGAVVGAISDPSELMSGMVRNYMHRKIIDPFRVAVNAKFGLGVPTVTVTAFSVYGLSDVRRVDDVVARLAGVQLHASAVFEVGPLNGTVDGTVAWWPFNGPAVPLNAVFAVDRARMRVAVIQPLGTATGRPVLDGRVSLHMDGLRLLGPPTLMSLAARAMSTVFEEFFVEQFRQPLETYIQCVLDRVRLDTMVSQMLSSP